MLSDGSTINYSTKIINIGYPNPVAGFEDAKKPSRGLVAGIIDKLVGISSGLETVLGKLLEYDVEDYAVYIHGTPSDTSTLGGRGIGYSIVVSIYPRMDAGRKKLVE
jgi:hypothetical protein